MSEQKPFGISLSNGAEGWFRTAEELCNFYNRKKSAKADKKRTGSKKFKKAMKKG